MFLALEYHPRKDGGYDVYLNKKWKATFSTQEDCVKYGRFLRKLADGKGICKD